MSKKKSTSEANISDVIQRSVLPIPDKQYAGLTTYDAKDPNSKYPPINWGLQSQDIQPHG